MRMGYAVKRATRDITISVLALGKVKSMAGIPYVYVINVYGLGFAIKTSKRAAHAFFANNGEWKLRLRSRKATVRRMKAEYYRDTANHTSYGWDYSTLWTCSELYAEWDGKKLCLVK